MSATYTVAEHHDGFSVFRDGNPVSWWGRKAIADEQAHSLNVHEHAFEMLNLLIESHGPFGLPEEWKARRDNILAEIGMA